MPDGTAYRFAAALTAVAWLAAARPDSTAQADPAEARPADYRIISQQRDDAGVTHITVASPFQRDDTIVRIAIPDPPPPADKHRILFVLPVEAGLGTQWGDGLATVLKHDLHKRHGLIVVAPTFSDLPWYADHPTDQKLRQESYVLKVVVPLVDHLHPTPPARRFLLGFSKSGWGAWSLLLRHPDTFAAAAAWDAPLMKDRPDQFGMGPIFGTQENFKEYEVARLLEARAVALHGEPRLILTGYGNFRQHHGGCHALLEKLRIAHRYVDGPRRRHHWDSGWVEPTVRLLLAEDKER